MGRPTVKIADTWVELIGAIVVLVAAVLALYEYREHKAGVQVEQMERLYDDFNSPAMLATRARAAAQPESFGRDAYQVFVFLEKLARWEEKGLVNVDDLKYYFQDPIQLYWYTWEGAIRKHRTAAGGDPELYEGVERMTKLLEKEGIKPPTEAQLREWLEFEILRAAPAPTTGKPQAPPQMAPANP